MIRYSDNVIPVSPAMTRAILMINRAFANPWGRQKAQAREMCGLGPRSQATRARYGDIAAVIRRQELNLHDAILHLKFARNIERSKIAPNRYQLARYLEALMLLRWLRRYDRHSYYSVRDAICASNTIGPRSW